MTYLGGIEHIHNLLEQCRLTFLHALFGALGLYKDLDTSELYGDVSLFADRNLLCERHDILSK